MSNYNNVKVAVIGAGITGQSCLRYLTSKGAEVTVFDTRKQSQNTLNVCWGEIGIDRLLNFSLIVASPGVSLSTPAIRKAIATGIEVVGDVELFARQNTVPAIGVTGSNGKSTVVSLLGEIFSEAKFDVCVSGNIGTPVLNTLADTSTRQSKGCDWYVLELSSFQLESTFSLNLDIACILNLSEDHLDRHGNMTEYRAAKQRIYAHANHRITCRDEPLLEYGRQDDTLTFGLSSSSVGMSWEPSTQTIIYQGEAFLHFSDCQLSGLHNVLNIQAASLIAIQAGIEYESILSAVKRFSGLPHRYQSLFTTDQINWINDSKATNPGATNVSLRAAISDTRGQLILIVGGDAKQADLSILKEQIVNSVSYLIALGKDGRQFMPLAQRAIYVDSMTQAVNIAATAAMPGDTVLLSPACASLDMFENFEHRGNCFVAAVQALVA
jgi:UDP-N-acetylmuramoylalanine--D-glutamate ligase